MSGSIELTYGPMCSGKTMWLLHSCLGKLADIGLKTLLILNQKDFRPELTENSFSTHSSSLRKKHQDIDVVKVSSLKEVDVDEYNSIGIDEAQFFSSNDMKILIDWYLQGKHLYVSALDGDYERQTFGFTHQLIPYVKAGCLNKFGAICIPCLSKGRHHTASYTYKKTNRDHKNVIDPGGAEKYVPVCGSCYTLLESCS